MRVLFSYDIFVQLVFIFFIIFILFVNSREFFFKKCFLSLNLLQADNKSEYNSFIIKVSTFKYK